VTDSALPRRRRRKTTAGVAVVAVAVLAAAAVTERSRVAVSLTVLGHLRWSWLPAAIVLESVSMAAFAAMFRRLLTAGRVRHGRVSMLATVYGANAVSVTVPLAGPELATAILFRRFTRHGADGLLAGWVLLAGVIFNLANLLLMAGIAMVGMATAFPVAIGLALVVGVILSYVQQPKGNLGMLAAGVLCALVAVVLDGKAYGELGSGRKVSRKGLVVSVVSGLLMSLWAPFSTRALTHGNPLGEYSVCVFLTLGALLSCFIWNFYFMEHPLEGGEPVAFSGFFHGPARGHLLGLLGGGIWATGLVFFSVASHYTGVAISYSIGQSAPMVAALWGIFAWKEFAGANRRAQAYLALMFIFYILAILLVSRANTAA